MACDNLPNAREIFSEKSYPALLFASRLFSLIRIRGEKPYNVTEKGCTSEVKNACIAIWETLASFQEV